MTGFSCDPDLFINYITVSDLRVTSPLILFKLLNVIYIAQYFYMVELPD